MSIRLIGNSGCTLSLEIQNSIPVIKKSNGKQLDLDYAVLRNIANHGIKVPDHYLVTPDEVVMRYIDGLSMLDYIQQGKDLDRLLEFLSNTIRLFELRSAPANITELLQQKFATLAPIQHTLKFNLHELYDRLPKTVPIGLYHGDLALGNMLYWNDEFYLIDAHYNSLQSVAFDSAKLRQDSEVKWFCRHTEIDATTLSRFKYINDNIKKINQYTSNNDLLVFMLVRVIPYCRNTQDIEFLIQAIDKLWI